MKGRRRVMKSKKNTAPDERERQAKIQTFFGSASWPKETVCERIKKIPEVIDSLGGFEKIKFKIGIDYDPELPRSQFTLDDGMKSMEERLAALEAEVQKQSTNRWLWIATTVIVSATLVIQILDFLG